MKYINDLLEGLKRKNINIKASTDDQMQRLFALSPQNMLPEAYVEFMRAIGNGAKGYMPGESCFMNEIDFLREGAIELLEEDESKEMITKDDFVFWMSQGCSFCFFKLSEGDNPPVYFYNEGQTERFIKIADSLTEYLFNRLDTTRDCFMEKAV